MSRAKAATPRKDAAGRWWFVVDAGRDPLTGKRRQVKRRGFKTREEARQALTKAQDDLDRGTFVRASTITVGESLAARGLPAMALRVERSTLTSYGQHVDVYVVPRLGAVALQGLEAAHLNGLYAELRERGG